MLYTHEPALSIQARVKLELSSVDRNRISKRPRPTLVSYHQTYNINAGETIIRRVDHFFRLNSTPHTS